MDINVTVQTDCLFEFFELVVKLNLTVVIMYVYLQGEFQSVDHPVEAPFTPTPFPASSNSTSMLYGWVSDYAFNSASFVYMKAGFMNRTITDKDVSIFGIKLILVNGNIWTWCGHFCNNMLFVL